jgi:hypothetical protein
MAVKTRIFRVAQSYFYGDEILSVLETHTAQRLKTISEAGFNGIWLRGRLRELAPGSLFQNYVNDVEQRIKSLKKLVKRASDYNLGVWLFFTEPLGLPCSHPFWKEKPELIGQKTKILDEEPGYSLCSSTPEVQSYLREGFREIFSVTEPAGVILITSSEQINNCWAHVLSDPKNYPCPEKFWAAKCHCPRCSERSPAEVISEVVNLVHAGVNESSHPGKVVAWDWSWNMHCKPPYKPISDRINPDVILMGDFERGLHVKRLGKERIMEEYSLVCPGPSKRFKSKVKSYAKEREIFAKLQINTTHELATVPNLPLVVSLFRKFKYMNDNGVTGTMASWNFALFPDTLNVYAVNKWAKLRKNTDERSALLKLAQDYFEADKRLAEKIVDCWYGFKRAAQNYPVDGYIFLYWSPINYALAYPLKDEFENKPMGPSWEGHKWGDRLEDTLGIYSMSEMVKLLCKLSCSWQKVQGKYQAALKDCDNSERSQKELAAAGVAGCIFRSTYNIYLWYHLKKNKCGQAGEEAVIADEIENLQNALSYIGDDERFGYHQEPQIYIFDKKMIQSKLDNLRDRIAH